MNFKDHVRLDRILLQNRQKELDDKSRINNGLSEEDITECREIGFKLRNLNASDGCLFQE